MISLDDFQRVLPLLFFLCVLGGMLGSFCFRVLEVVPDVIADLADAAHRRFFPSHYYAWRERLFIRGQELRKRLKKERADHARRYRHGRSNV